MIDQLSKNTLSQLSRFDLEFCDNGVSYLDTFVAKQTILGTWLIDNCQERKDKRIQFNMATSSTWN